MLHHVINSGQSINCQDAISPITLSRFQAFVWPAIQSREVDVPLNTHHLEVPLPSPYDLHDVKGYLTVRSGDAYFELTIDSNSLDFSSMNWVSWDADAQPAVWHEASEILRQMARDGLINLPATFDMPVSSKGLVSALLIDSEPGSNSLDELQAWLLGFSRYFALALLAILSEDDFIAEADASSQA